MELVLRDSDATRAAWPHAFELRLRASLSPAGALRQDATVRNAGDAPLAFTAALHTYFRVADAARAAVRGLTGCAYLDSLDGRARKAEAADAVTFAAEVDRVYLRAPPVLTLDDAAGGRRFTLATRGLPDAIVWNPWVAKAKAMADFGARRGLCGRLLATSG